MPRLIDADALREHKFQDETAEYRIGWNCAIDAIVENAPTIDAVPVVRCKDCKWCKKHSISDKVNICTNEWWNTEYYPLVTEDDFCSCGERRTDD